MKNVWHQSHLVCTNTSNVSQPIRAREAPNKTFLCGPLYLGDIFFCMFFEPIGLVPCVPSNTLRSPAFKGVTHGMSFKHTSPPPVTLVVWSIYILNKPIHRFSVPCYATISHPPLPPHALHYTAAETNPIGSTHLVILSEGLCCSLDWVVSRNN